MSSADGTYGYYSAPADIIITLVSSWIERSKPVLNILEDQAIQYFPAQVSTIKTFLENNQSPLAKHLPLMNPFHVLSIVIGYLLAVFIGKQITKNLPRLDVKFFSLLHNLGLALLSGYMFYGILFQSIHDKYSLFGNPADHTRNGLPMAKIVWVFYVSKIWEFVDTMIMIVKKNYRQISFLHVYHHSTIFGIWWYVTLIAPNGEAYFSAAFNSLIHVIMYGYYFCSAIGIKQVSLIKRYITTCQMFQFSCMFVQATYNIINAFILRPNPAEHYSTQLSVILWFYMISMLGLFYNFFVQDQKRAKLAKLAKKEAKLE